MTFKNHLFWIIAFIGLVADQITKYWTVQALALGETVPIWEGVFHFTFVTNTGAAFSLFSDNGTWLRWLSLLVSLGLMAFAWLGPRLNRLEQVGYGFILGGALGNGIDRFATGEVVDFLDFRLIRFPVFNVADICINIGILCILIAAFTLPPDHPGDRRPS
ncbi:MAG: lipoprotein signal peptidase [Synechococcales cyanobacterium K44_A2020_017]|jgi:signal peptidase II|nr:lipoprotein signal peptidase [Synechococcales cyanobacterium K32_A2020_035]MBF2093874.1 lipoprotein signal peptidase [Synechococcales cyanobacterium K44_A2020_017]